MARVFGNPKFKAIFNDGTPVVGGKVYTYVTGTSTLAQTWSDSGHTALNTNPIVLDSNGECWLFPDDIVYRIRVEDADGGLVWDKDGLGEDIGSSGVTLFESQITGSQGATFIGFTQAKTDAQPTTLAVKLLEHVSFFDFMTDAEKINVRNNLGTIDVTTACQNALNSVSGTVYAPPGTYLVGEITIPSPAKIQGAGQFQTIFKGKTGTDFVLKLEDYCEVDSIGIDRQTKQNYGIKVLAKNCSLNNISTKKCNWAVGISNSSTQTRISNWHSSNCTFDLDVIGVSYGIHVCNFFWGPDPDLGTGHTGALTESGAAAHTNTSLVNGVIKSCTSTTIAGTYAVNFNLMNVIFDACTTTFTYGGSGWTMLGCSFVGGSGTPAFGGGARSNVFSVYNGVFYLGMNTQYTSLATQSSLIIGSAATPNGSVTANQGSEYLSANGGSATTLWVKESGNGTNTGWVGK